jgi:ribosome recycling factor
VGTFVASGRLHQLQPLQAKGGKGGAAAPAAASGEFVWKTFRKGTEEKMTKSLDSIQAQFNTLRAGGANPAMLDRIFVDVFGTPTPLQQVARVGSSGSQQLVIEPFDKSICKEIEKAISSSDLNLTPTNDGSGIVRINVPPLTEDRRKELVKQAKVILEDGKVAVRNHRRDSVDKVKDLEKAKTISKDDAKGFQDDLQKLTDDFIKKLDGMLKKKEDDLMKV